MNSERKYTWLTVGRIITLIMGLASLYMGFRINNLALMLVGFLDLFVVVRVLRELAQDTKKAYRHAIRNHDDNV